MKYYYFYDLNEVLIDRYPAKITSLISSKSKINNFIFIYSEKYNNSTPQNIPDGCKSFYIPNLSKKSIEQIISQYPPNSLTTIAQRIPDMWMLSLFNHLGYPTFIVQHGLWSDRIERIQLVPLLLSKFSKLINYIQHTRSICKLNNLSYAKMLYELYRFSLKEDINIPETSQLNRDMLRAKKAFVFDESWNDYYIKRYGYNAKNLIYIGNPDFLLLKNKDLGEKEDAVCYLCQSLVEDGRFINSEYQFFLNLLKDKIASTKKLYIKFHPRSRIDLYNVLKNNANVVFTNDLPICKYYIGHYTGLLATVAQISNDILIWKLPKHHTPDYFLQFGSIISDNPNELKYFISGKYDRIKIQCKKFTTDELNSFNPLKTISDTLLKLKNE
jgi:hypothetical protein